MRTRSLLVVLFALIVASCGKDVTAPVITKPQFTTIGIWCPWFDFDGSFRWVWIEGNTCPPVHYPGGYRDYPGIIGGAREVGMRN